MTTSAAPRYIARLVLHKEVSRMSKKAYQAPVIRAVGSLQELTLLTQKQDNNTPDGFAFHGIILTS